MKHQGFPFSSLPILTIFVVFGLAMFSSGCGTVEEGTGAETGAETGTEEEWTNTTPFSETARLEYRIDSLMNENRKLQQQNEAVSSENRNLSARNTELDAKVREAATARPPVTTTTPAVTSPSVPNASYESALSKYRGRRFRDAIDEFNTLINRGIGGGLLDNCHYWIGESYFGMKSFTDAIQHFEVVLGMSGSDKRDDAQYMIGNSYFQLGRRDDARSAFQKLISSYPSSPLVGRAKSKLNSL